jgi:hypothetical protein
LGGKGQSQNKSELKGEMLKIATTAESGTARNLGREERYRTVISGMEPRRIAEVMLLPRVQTIEAPRYGIDSLPVNHNLPVPAHRLEYFTLRTASLHGCHRRLVRLARACQDERDVVGLLLVADPVIDRVCHNLRDLGQRLIPVSLNQFY